MAFLLAASFMPKEVDYKRLPVEMEKGKMLVLKGYWPEVAENLTSNIGLVDTTCYLFQLSCSVHCLSRYLQT